MLLQSHAHCYQGLRPNVGDHPFIGAQPLLNQFCIVFSSPPFCCLFFSNPFCLLPEAVIPSLKPYRNPCNNFSYSNIFSIYCTIYIIHYAQYLFPLPLIILSILPFKFFYHFKSRYYKFTTSLIPIPPSSHFIGYIKQFKHSTHLLLHSLLNLHIPLLL